MNPIMKSTAIVLLVIGLSQMAADVFHLPALKAVLLPPRRCSLPCAAWKRIPRAFSSIGPTGRASFIPSRSHPIPLLGFAVRTTGVTFMARSCPTGRSCNPIREFDRCSSLCRATLSVATLRCYGNWESIPPTLPVGHASGWSYGPDRGLAICLSPLSHPARDELLEPQLVQGLSRDLWRVPLATLPLALAVGRGAIFFRGGIA